jgi:hypothetical protein
MPTLRISAIQLGLILVSVLTFGISAQAQSHVARHPDNTHTPANPIETTPTPAPTRDPQAVGVIQSSIAALGGAAYYSQTSGVIAQGTITAAPAAVSGQITRENQGPEFMEQRPGPNGPILFLSGHGNPAIVANGNIQQGIGQLAMNYFPLHLPAVGLNNALNNPNLSVSSIQQTTMNGESAIEISTVDDTSSLSAAICQQTWYFDATTLLPFRVDYLTSDVSNALNTMQETTLLSNYQQVSGALIPFKIVTFLNGQQISETDLTSVQLDVSIPSSDFDPPTTSTTGAQ